MQEVHILIVCINMFFWAWKHVAFYFQLLYMTIYASKHNTIKKMENV